ncbi:MAG: esterase [Polaromonas sp.]|uniref:esterase n=1 Tax=Polaromonas sp. TaxID=1869339 RepID=UPI00272FCDB9|nr:esterase [Polaromonas sp.]MDP1739805.1 esterase [Polaromonas sp.]MDP1955767.1 esterase [Polaromonas sp.]MDP3355294.1 esterase [Polaromonas sp.]MDP3751637.1 esterase [Polaromonas sp.]
MNPDPLDTLELLPATAPRQLFVLLHGDGAAALDMLALATLIGESFGEAAVVMPEGFEAIHLGKTVRQWFPTFELTDSNRAERVAKAVPTLAAFIRQQQERFGILQSDTALAGFAEGATLALALSDTHDGLVGRVLAFSGRYAALPDKAPGLTTLHLLHGQQDAVVPVQLTQQAYAELMALGADATCDIASSVGHELHPALMAQAIHRLQTCVPLRFWRSA